MAFSHTVDVGGLLAGGRQRLAVEQQVALEPFEGIRFLEPARVRLTISAAGEALEIAGSIDAVMNGECVRCLEPVGHSLRVEVDERLDAGIEARRDPRSASNVLAGDRLDVADLTQQLVLSAVPLGLLCSSSCKGICPLCGENKNERACACPHDDGD